MYSMRMLVMATVTVAFFGCATSPKPGDVTHAQVIMVVGDWLYQRVASRDQYEILNNPPRTRAIQDAIDAGVSIEDVREGRLVLSSCRYGTDSGYSFVTLLPKGVVLPPGARVELELVAGSPYSAGRPGTLSEFRRVLPARPQGRTDCFPETGS